MASGPIQIIPAGLLGLLQLKSNGQNPDKLDDVVQPQLDILQLYFQQQQQRGFLTSGVTLTTSDTGFKAFSPAINIPSNELWRIHSCTITTGNYAPATDLIQFAVAMCNTTGQAIVELLDQQSSTSFDNSGFTPTIRNKMQTARDFWAYPGSSLGAFVQEVQAATSLTLALRLRYTILPL